MGAKSYASCGSVPLLDAPLSLLLPFKTIHSALEYFTHIDAKARVTPGNELLHFRANLVATVLDHRKSTAAVFTVQQQGGLINTIRQLPLTLIAHWPPQSPLLAFSHELALFFANDLSINLPNLLHFPIVIGRKDSSLIYATVKMVSDAGHRQRFILP